MTTKYPITSWECRMNTHKPKWQNTPLSLLHEFNFPSVFASTDAIPMSAILRHRGTAIDELRATSSVNFAVARRALLGRYYHAVA